jgi:hypothetical protein
VSKDIICSYGKDKRYSIHASLLDGCFDSSLEAVGASKGTALQAAVVSNDGHPPLAKACIGYQCFVTAVCSV